MRNESLHRLFHEREVDTVGFLCFDCFTIEWFVSPLLETRHKPVIAVNFKFEASLQSSKHVVVFIKFKLNDISI